MKYSKAAAVVIGAVAAAGVAAPAFAAPHAPEPGSQLLTSDTNSKQHVKNPLGDLDAKALLGSLDKVADKLKTKNHTKAGTRVPMIGGLPAGVPIG